MNHQPFAMTKPSQKALSRDVVVSSPRHSENNTFTLIFPLMGSMAGGFYWHYSMWLFHLHSAVENTAFFPVFPLAESTAKAFFRLSLWNFKEKTSIFFYNTAILLVTPLEFRESASHFLMARPSKTSGKRMIPLRAITQKSRSRGRGIYVPDVVSGTTAPEEAVPVHTISRLLSTPCRE